MNDETRKLLTEFLGDSSFQFFRTQEAMMALYRAIHKKSYIPDWDGFFHYMMGRYKQSFNLFWNDFSESGFTAWLFCLSGSGYEERCQMVADWLEGRDKK